MAGRIVRRSIVVTAWGVWLVCGLAMWRHWVDGPTISFIGSSAVMALLLLEKLGVKRRLVGDRGRASSPPKPEHSSA